MKASEELKAARDELFKAIKPALEAYEQRTGLMIVEIAIERPYEVVGKEITPVYGVKVRNNANLL